MSAIVCFEETYKLALARTNGNPTDHVSARRWGSGKGLVPWMYCCPGHVSRFEPRQLLSMGLGMAIKAVTSNMVVVIHDVRPCVADHNPITDFHKWANGQKDKDFANHTKIVVLEVGDVYYAPPGCVALPLYDRQPKGAAYGHALCFPCVSPEAFSDLPEKLRQQLLELHTDHFNACGKKEAWVHARAYFESFKSKTRMSVCSFQHVAYVASRSSPLVRCPLLLCSIRNRT